MTGGVTAFFAERGLAYNPHPDVVPNSMDALRLTELARELDAHEAVHDRLMDAYWTEGLDIGDRAVLRELGLQAGLPAERVEEVLATDAYRDLVEASTRQAQQIGVTGVPGFLLDRQLLVLGAQPEAIFERAFAQLDG